ncbi:hypothetical protein MPTK1_3g11910 [Marchantia polymorpha subsp. ruderalis]|uniref:Uncharacterized protein n=2 Tax=Marchantia polymorpha TaxID=3197 RepID=A0AAF6AZV9_MARPO|nr:hypothetical protein MARPO_0037s0006 [Marchantia polymorpha]BBN05293.1 hypothetical protein Mp_3g11910 [Marchantia polymorpha subsp. ruderalis]|eukprot:PTQ40811.1 hypothetical protein MARPO_0037s0006 [Marchantia polymorpha]
MPRVTENRWELAKSRSERAKREDRGGRQTGWVQLSIYTKLEVGTKKK